jgi:AcrR family transcriptional regulator
MAHEFQRARRPEQKQQRYDAILAAAQELAVRDSVRDVSLADIAAEVGMHKSALLKYFSTRDEIYLRLAASLWTEWTAAARTALATADSISAVAAAFAETLAIRPLFCDLIAHVSLNLERNVPVESAREYKHVVLPVIGEMLATVQAILPFLDEMALFDLIATLSAVAASLHQVANPPPTLAALYRSDPELGHTAVEFTPTLQRITETFLIGLKAR